MEKVVQLGLMRAAPLRVVMEEERAAAEAAQRQPIIDDLAGYVRKCWTDARDAKRNTVEPRLLQNMRARRAEYDPDKLAKIREQGGSEIFANLTSVKCRAAGGWIRDVIMSTGTERPWTLRPTPVPDLPPEINDSIVGLAMEPLKQALLMGAPVSQAEVTQNLSSMRDQALAAVREEATKRAARMADKMEDQLIEGGFLDALDKFIDDLTTFPSAIIKGPVVRKRPKLRWRQDESDQMRPIISDELCLEWERVSPFDIYPAPSATTIDDGYLIQKHTLTRSDLQALIGVDGYSDATIRTVLDEYGRGGLRDWLMADEVEQLTAEGKSTTSYTNTSEGLIDALQFWGTVQGKCLIEWGMPEDEVPDPTREYDVEVWLVGRWVIKAVLNYDPLRRKPYYKASYETVPGSWWGNSVADLVRDVQQVVNASARALVNNMGLASGPQVAINVDRLPPGEDITQLTPWKIWQVTTDPYGNSTQQPVQFFQPSSNVNELLTVFEKFSQLADEYSGIPRYLTGDTTGGAGRTASGLSMLINNAGKSIKQVIGNIDMAVINPLIERLYIHNMQYAEDPDLKGDVAVVARGASSLIAKESAQVRRNEFLAATANPIDMQIVGPEGRAAILRETAKTLDMNPDAIVPPIEVLRQKWQAQAMQQQQLMGPAGSGQELMDGGAVTDNFSPPPKPANAQ